jgi:hypothetical protein
VSAVKYPVNLFVVLAILGLSRTALAFDGFFVTEKIQEKLVCASGCSEIPSGSFTARCSLGLFEGTVAAMDENTSVIINIGSLHLTRKLGDDPNYQAGDTKATFENSISVNGKSKVVLRIKLSWAKGNFVLRLKGITPQVGSPIAASLIGSAPGDISVNVPLEFKLQTTSGSVGLSGSPLFTGKLIRKTKNVDATTYELDNVKIAGAATS